MASLVSQHSHSVLRKVERKHGKSEQKYGRESQVERAVLQYRSRYRLRPLPYACASIAVAL
jgi:hypothetical protein